MEGVYYPQIGRSATILVDTDLDTDPDSATETHREEVFTDNVVRLVPPVSCLCAHARKYVQRSTHVLQEMRISSMHLHHPE
jgi:hypothetical protein